MKQKVFSILLTLLMSMVANMAMAYDAEIDGIYYNFEGTEATVTSGDIKYTGDIVIPSTVNYNNIDYFVTSIRNNAFSWCSSLTSISIPNSVSTIGGYAFTGCSGLTSITIPNSVTTIEEATFSGCSGLTSIAIPNGVTSIGTQVFDGCSGLTSITIPNSVTSICGGAFAYCSGLTSIEIPYSVTDIEVEAFTGCTGMTAIVVETGNPIYDSRNNCNAIIETSSNTLIAGCQNSTIPNSVTSIGQLAFADCSSLTSISIPNSVKNIGESAFYHCSGLISIEIPYSVTNIEEWAFTGCTGMTAIVVGSNSKYDSRNNCNAIIETSSNTLLFGCQNTVIPSSVISIGSSAFRDCIGLTSIEIPSSVTSIGDGAFIGCSSLTSIEIPSSVTSIGDDAFNSCSGLTSVTIGNRVTSIGNYVFSGCSSLTSIVVEEGNTRYDSHNNCNAIIETSSNTLIAGCKNTVIPNSVTSIGEVAFSGCSGLTFISIPNSVSTIGNSAFSGCRSLTDVYCYAEAVPTTDLSAFGSTRSNITLHVPTVSIDAYQAAEPWSGFKEIIGFGNLEVSDLNIINEESSTLEVGLTNNISNLVAFQMDLTLPEGISIDKTGCTLSSRITDEDQDLVIGKLESGAYRITSTSLSLTPISGNEGALLSLTLTAEDGCEGGEATISNIIFSTAESERITISDVTFDITVLKKYNLSYMVGDEEYYSEEVAETTPLTPIDEPTMDGYTFGGWSEIPETMPNHDVAITGRFYLFGDVNKDEAVDVVDVVDIARFVVATPSVNFSEKLADLNNDNTVNIADAVRLVNCIAGETNFARAMAPLKPYNYDMCQLQLVSTQENTLSFCLNGDADFTAFQFEVELPENIDITAMKVNGQRMNSHQLLYNKVGENRYRVAALSLSNAVFKGNEGELLSISIDGQATDAISVHDILFVTKDAAGITFEAVSLSEVTGISDVRANEGNRVIYDLQGRKLSKMQCGVNIVNGKKVTKW